MRGEKRAGVPEEYKRTVTNEDILELPLGRYDGEVQVVRSEGQLKMALKYLAGENILGFDTESRPVFKKGFKPNLPSILQLACRERVFVFQLDPLGFSNGLTEILADPSVVKAGVAVRDDVIALKRLNDFDGAGFVDLGTVAADQDMKTRGLRNLTANLLGFRMSKGAQCSNWAKDRLTEQQVAYAATDAWAGRELYLAFKEFGVV